MARPTKTKNAEQLNIRLGAEAIARADALIEHLSDSQGIAGTRTDVLRSAIMLGLRQLELEKAAGVGVGRRRRPAS